MQMELLVRVNAFWSLPLWFPFTVVGTLAKSWKVEMTATFHLRSVQLWKVHAHPCLGSRRPTPQMKVHPVLARKHQRRSAFSTTCHLLLWQRWKHANIIHLAKSHTLESKLLAVWDVWQFSVLCDIFLSSLAFQAERKLVALGQAFTSPSS